MTMCETKRKQIMEKQMKIWHKSDEKPEAGKLCLLSFRGVGSLHGVELADVTDDGVWHDSDEKPISCENLEKWAYVDELTDEGTADTIRKEAYQEVFWDFVLPLCNELLEYNNPRSELSEWKEDVFRYLYAIQTYIEHGAYSGWDSDEEWEIIKARIDKFLGKRETTDNGGEAEKE